MVSQGLPERKKKSDFWYGLAFLGILFLVVFLVLCFWVFYVFVFVLHAVKFFASDWEILGKSFLVYSLKQHPVKMCSVCFLCV